MTLLSVRCPISGRSRTHTQTCCRSYRKRSTDPSATGIANGTSHIRLSSLVASRLCSLYKIHRGKVSPEIIISVQEIARLGPNLDPGVDKTHRSCSSKIHPEHTKPTPVQADKCACILSTNSRTQILSISMSRCMGKDHFSV